MFSHSLRWSITASWLALALIVFIAAGTTSIYSWVLLATFGLMPPLVMMSLWHEPSLTMAEVLREIDARR